MNNTQIAIINWGNNLLNKQFDQQSVCEWVKAAAEQYNAVPVSNEFHNQANAIRAKFVKILCGDF
jgi:hypothetical protein